MKRAVYAARESDGEQSNGTDLRDAGLDRAVNGELEKAGYRALGASNSLFQRTEEWQAERLLAGAMKELAGNGCFPRAMFGDMTVSAGEVSMEIEWQLFDRRSQSVILTVTTGGNAQRSSMPDGLRQAYVGTVAASLRNFLAEPRAVAALTRPATVAASPRSALSVPVIALDDKAPVSTDLIAYTRRAVVTIPIGTGHGSGFVISRSGLVLTNAHGGEGTSALNVELLDGRRVKGEVVRVDRRTDVALVQLQSGQYPPLPSAPPSASVSAIRSRAMPPFTPAPAAARRHRRPRPGHRPRPVRPRPRRRHRRGAEQLRPHRGSVARPRHRPRDDDRLRRRADGARDAALTHPR